jgi:ABC-type branched-subunit amino acid transport system permease subunit
MIDRTADTIVIGHLRIRAQEAISRVFLGTVTGGSLSSAIALLLGLPVLRLSTVVTRVTERISTEIMTVSGASSQGLH